MRKSSPENEAQMAKIIRISQGSVSKIMSFCWAKINITSLLHLSC